MRPRAEPEQTELPVGGENAWRAFWTLHGDRPFAVQGFGTPMGATVIEPIPGRIRFADIDVYARRLKIRGEVFFRLLHLVVELDHEYLQFAAERSRQRWAQMQKQG